MCFIGHGAFGILTKESWVGYFAVVGIGHDRAYALMPVIGSLDITMGIILLVAPVPIVAWWMLAWAIWTAILRPLAGEPVWEALERAGNYGVPAALLIWMTNTWRWRGMLNVGFRELTPDLNDELRQALKVAVVLLLVGHGLLGLIPKAGQVTNVASVFPASMAANLTQLMAMADLALAAWILVRPSVPLLFIVAAWKVLTEALFVTSGSPVWEFVERGGSYAVPVALAILIAISERGAGEEFHTPQYQPLSTG
jgi:hypothetical protein